MKHQDLLGLTATLFAHWATDNTPVTVVIDDLQRLATNHQGTHGDLTARDWLVHTADSDIRALEYLTGLSYTRYTHSGQLPETPAPVTVIAGRRLRHGQEYRGAAAMMGGQALILIADTVHVLGDITYVPEGVTATLTCAKGTGRPATVPLRRDSNTRHWVPAWPQASTSCSDSGERPGSRQH